MVSIGHVLFTTHALLSTPLDISSLAQYGYVGRPTLKWKKKHVAIFHSVSVLRAFSIGFSHATSMCCYYGPVQLKPVAVLYRSC